MGPCVLAITLRELDLLRLLLSQYAPEPNSEAMELLKLILARIDCIDRGDDMMRLKPY